MLVNKKKARLNFLIILNSSLSNVPSVSAVLLELNLSFFDSFGSIIFDECHSPTQLLPLLLLLLSKIGDDECKSIFVEDDNDSIMLILLLRNSSLSRSLFVVCFVNFKFKNDKDELLFVMSMINACDDGSITVITFCI